MTGTKHFNFDEEAEIIAYNLMIRNGLIEEEEEQDEIFEELAEFNKLRVEQGFNEVTLEEYCEIAGYDIDAYIDNSYKGYDVVEDYIEDEYEDEYEDDDIWNENDEDDLDEWEEDEDNWTDENYEFASEFDKNTED